MRMTTSVTWQSTSQQQITHTCYHVFEMAMKRRLHSQTTLLSSRGRWGLKIRNAFAKKTIKHGFGPWAPDSMLSALQQKTHKKKNSFCSSIPSTILGATDVLFIRFLFFQGWGMGSGAPWDHPVSCWSCVRSLSNLSWFSSKCRLLFSSSKLGREEVCHIICWTHAAQT